MEEKELKRTPKKPAITISIQSWATPIVGVAMLLIGLIGGYYGRPIIRGESEQGAAPPTIAQAQPEGAEVSNDELMDYLKSQVRHFKGDPNATVTLVEFGDFQ
jgi:hypothetical protein